MSYISFEDVCKDYPAGNTVVHASDHVNFQIEKGEFCVVLGPSGAGKTTVLNLLGGMDKATSGRIIVGDKEITGLRSPQLTEYRRHDVGFVFQFYNLMPNLTALENVELAQQVCERALDPREVLEQVGLGQRMNNFPAQLSGGEQQRVSIARALCKNPALLLCDEPTGALDSKTGEQVLDLLTRLCHDYSTTVVIITHEMAVVKEICDRVAVMEHGRVVEQGEVFNVFADPRQEITRSFIHTTSNLRKIEELIAEDSPVVKLNPGELIVRLSYIQRNVSEPLISTVSRKFDIVLNIIFSDIAIVQNAPIGGTVAIISGEREQITQAIAYLSEKNVGVEVIKDARVSE